MSELCHDGVDIFRGSDKEHLILSLHDGVPTWRDWLALPKNRGDSRFNIGDVIPQGNDSLADKRPIMVGAHRRELYTAFGEVENLQSARVLQQLFDLIGNNLLRIDQHVDRHVILSKEVRTGQIRRCAYSSNLHRRFE